MPTFSGSRISLISKKNIRYEGTLYSINEGDATVALQDVKSYGTEGRELLDTTGASTFVPPNDVVHAYLVFRGQDIKDLHVHEKAKTEETVTSPAAATEGATAAPSASNEAKSTEGKKPADGAGEEKKGAAPEKQPPKKQQQQGNGGGKKAQTKSAPAKGAAASGDSKENKPAQKKGGGGKNQNMVGSGASLLNRKARGAKGEGSCHLFIM